MNDELPIGPTLLAPGVDDRGDRVARKILIPMVVLFVAVVVVFYVLFSVTVVDGESMEPSLLDSDRVLTTKTYSQAHRGDVVVFRTIDGSNNRSDLIKRVMAIEGDTVSVENGVATVNGVVEDTASVRLSEYDRSSVAALTVGPGTVFVMGDNRPISLDSRDIGAVPLEAIRGRAVFLFAPINRTRVIR